MASSARDDFADSDAEHPDTHTRDTTFSSIERQSSSPSKRRRPSNQTPPPQVKRLKQESPSPIAPPVSISPQLWQHIFTFLPPESLAPVLRVNKLFFDLLTNPTLAPNDDQEPGRVSLRSPEAIWTISRKTYHPEWPEPLAGLPELTFWQLILRSTCQFCQRKLRAIYDTGSPWESGPGHDGISVVWQFGIRTCGPCLMERVQSESSLLFSDHSALLSALPFAFISSSHHAISFTTMRSGQRIPPSVELAKYYFTPHLEQASQRLTEARQISAAIAKERFDQLLAEKEDRMASAVRWEQSDILSRMEASWSGVEVGHRLSTTPKTASTSPTGHQAAASMLASSGRPPSTSMSGKFTPLHRHQQSASRLGRSLNEAIEGKAARRAAIEQRCRDLESPIPESLLPHMESFMAAIQISNPLTEDAWNMLKPRLLAQRPQAEQREHDRIIVEQASAADLEERKKQEAALKEIKEEADRAWEESQGPVRARLAVYADNIIRDYWSGGDAVTHDSIPKFAAQVLVDVRARYFSDLAREGSLPRSGEDFRERTPTLPRKLVLDNMRWVYDNKIKPLTEVRKEMFLCNGCDVPRYYAFDGVVQHYAAKHTEAFSLGHIVVHWQNAEWPENPPFAPDPEAKRGSLPGPPHGPYPPSGPPLHAPNASSHFQRPFHVAQAGPFAGHSAISPSPYGNPAYPALYMGHQAGPFPPPFMPSDRSQHSYSPSVGGRGAFQPPSYPGYIPSSPFEGRSHFYPPAGPGVPTPAPSHGTWSAPAYPHPYQVPPPPMQIPTNLYQAHLDEVANIARSTWGIVSNVRSLPQSVRMFIIIHNVVELFQQRFSNEPNLDLFTDCLINHKLMRPLKDADGLACKTCVLRNEAHDDGSHSPSYPLSTGERKLYPFHSLLVHFKNVHIEHANVEDSGGSQSRLDWKEDMIELPSDKFISSLSRAPGIDQQKMSLLMGAFPTISWASEGPPMTRDPIMGAIASIHSPVGEGRIAPVRQPSALSQMRTSGNVSRSSLQGPPSRLGPPPGSDVPINGPEAKEDGYDAPSQPSFLRQTPSRESVRRMQHGEEPSFEAPRASQAPSRRHHREGEPATPKDEGRATSAAPSTAGSRTSSRGGRPKYASNPSARASDHEARDYPGGRADEFLESMGNELQHDYRSSRPPASPPAGRPRSPVQQRSTISDETLSALREQGFIVLEPGAPVESHPVNVRDRHPPKAHQPRRRGRQEYSREPPDHRARHSQPPRRSEDYRYNVDDYQRPSRYRVIDRPVEEPVEYIYVRRNEAARYLEAADDYAPPGPQTRYRYSGPPPPGPPRSSEAMGYSEQGERGDDYRNEYGSRGSSRAPR